MNTLIFTRFAAAVRGTAAALAFSLCALCAVASAESPRWVLSVDGGLDHGFQISEGRKTAYWDRFTKPPLTLGTRPAFDTKLFAYTRLLEARGRGARVALDREWDLAGGAWAASAGVVLGFSRVDATYYFERWARFDGYNPYTPGFSGPPVLSGSGERRIQHHAVAPGLRARAARREGALRPWAEWGMGVQRLRFGNFDIHEAWAAPDMHPILIYGPLATDREYPVRRDHTFHTWLGAGLATDLGGGWELSVGYFINYLTGYRIRAVLETGSPESIDGPGSILTYGFPVENVFYRRVSVGFTRRW